MPTRKKEKTALVLASGGLTGVAYEVGALRALDHILTNRTVNDFDIYVGTSAGAVVSSALAGGMPPVVLAGLMAGTVPGFSRLSRLQLYQPNVGEAFTRLLKAPSLLRRAVGEYWQFRDRVPMSEALMNLSPLLPSGIFSNHGVENYIRETFATAGLSDDFRDVPRELHIVATDIEADRRVTFSRHNSPDVPISKAVAASSCIPILFRPVEIEGRHYIDGGIKGHAAIDVAIDRGATLVVIINGLVPLDTEAISRRATTDEGRRSIFDLGIRAIGNQVVRGMLHDTLIDHLREVRGKHPEVDFLLIEPQPDDEKMFFHEVMSFSAQMIVLQHGYETVMTGLYKKWSYLSRILPKHGIEVTRKIVDRKPLNVPVKDMERGGNAVARLFQTVLDRRGASGERPDITVAAEPPGSSRRNQARPAARKAPARKKLATTAPPPGARRRGGFRPRVISGGDSKTGS
ncbi:MAG: patatin-like phospholipase family protein [Candidatus Dormibacteraeota bacterium]|nr:patatin-like phospholipase family protein [Candidatus Dormibacteraeota bacterium]